MKKREELTPNIFISDMISIKNALSQLDEKERSPWGIVSIQSLEKLIVDAQAISDQKRPLSVVILNDAMKQHVSTICETVVKVEFLKTLKDDAQTREKWDILVNACKPFLTVNAKFLCEKWEAYIKLCQIIGEIKASKKVADEAQVPKKSSVQIQASKIATDELAWRSDVAKQRYRSEICRIELQRGLYQNLVREYGDPEDISHLRKVDQLIQGHAREQVIVEKQIDEAKKQAADSRAKRVQEIKAKQALSAEKKSLTHYSALVNLIAGISICSVVVALACLNVLSIGLAVGAVLFTATICAGVHFFSNRQKEKGDQQQFDNTLSHASI